MAGTIYESITMTLTGSTLWIISLSSLTLLGIAFAIVIYRWRSHGKRHQIQSALSDLNHRLTQLESRLDVQSTVPPMHIFLEPKDRRWHSKDELCRQIDRWMLQNDFERLGYFSIEGMNREELCTYLSQDRLLVGAIRMPLDISEPYVEFCFSSGPSGQRGGVGNPPQSTIGTTDGVAGRYFQGRLSDDLSLLDQMHGAARQLLQDHIATPVDPLRIAEFFEEAHAYEMACRVASGGISQQEILEALRRQGVQPTDRQVAAVQCQWQSAIQDYLLEFSPRGKNCLVAGHQLLIVHDGSYVNFLNSQLSQLLKHSLADAQEIQLLRLQLNQLLDRFPPRQAISRFCRLLPSACGLRLVDQLQQPVACDVYALCISDNFNEESSVDG
jgi:hypothetical protein